MELPTGSGRFDTTTDSSASSAASAVLIGVAGTEMAGLGAGAPPPLQRACDEHQREE